MGSIKWDKFLPGFNETFTQAVNEMSHIIHRTCQTVRGIALRAITAVRQFIKNISEIMLTMMIRLQPKPLRRQQHSASALLERPSKQSRLAKHPMTAVWVEMQIETQTPPSSPCSWNLRTKSLPQQSHSFQIDKQKWDQNEIEGFFTRLWNVTGLSALDALVSLWLLLGGVAQNSLGLYIH